MLQIYVTPHWTIRHQKMKDEKLYTKTVNIKITEMIWRTGFLFLKVLFVRYWIYQKIKEIG